MSQTLTGSDPWCRDKVLVAALHQQRPDQDADVTRNLSRAVRRYRERLCEVRGNDGLDSTLGIEGVGYYQPASSGIWGAYDCTTLYLADELSATVYVHPGSGAASHELIFGMLFSGGGDHEKIDLGPALRAVLAPTKSDARPLMGITRIKLSDPLLVTCGSQLRASFAAYATHHAKNALCIVMQSRSWHELTILLASADPNAILEHQRLTESVTLGDLLERDDALRQTVDDAVHGRANAGGRMAQETVRRWVKGRWTPKTSSPGEILQSLRRSHVVLAQRDQIGLHHEAGRLAVEDLDLPASVKDVCRWGVSWGTTPRPAIDEDAFRRELASGGSGTLSAVVQWFPKPGHAGPIIEEARQIARAMGSVDDLAMGTSGHGNAVSLRARFTPDMRGAMRLYALSHWMRLQPGLNAHLRDVCTTVEQPASLHPTDLSLPDGKHGPYGIRLFAPPRIDDVQLFEWRRLQRFAVGKIEAIALHSWITAVHHATAQPEMFGSMIDVYALLRSVCDEIFGTTGDRSQDEARALMRELVENGQRAYQQRLQFSPVQGGGPPILGEVPYGLGQVVGTMSGVARAVQRAFEPEDRPQRAPIVLFSPARTLLSKGIGNIGVFRLGTMQVVTPLSLGMLFDEGGRWFIRQQLGTGDNVRAFHRALAAAGEPAARSVWDAIQDIQRTMEAQGTMPRSQGKEKPKVLDRKDCPLSEERLAKFFEDILAHAAWRLVGCDKNMSVFETQFLAAPAMGFRMERPGNSPPRSSPSSDDRYLPFELWAETVAHLLIQRLLARNLDDADGLFRGHLALMTNRDKLERELGSAVDLALTFCSAELRHCLDVAGASVAPNSVKELLMQWADPWFEALTHLWGTNQAWSKLRKLLADLKTLALKISITGQELVARCPEVKALPSELRAGRVPPAPWEIIDANGYPNFKAVVWIREILTALTMDFVEAQRQGDYAIRRNRDNQVELDPEDKQGVYLDFTGGLFRVGPKQRTSYLRSQSAALDALEEVALKVRAGRIHRYFEQGRAFRRLGAGGRALLVNGNARITVSVLNTCPVGAGLAGRAAEIPREGAIVQLKAKDGKLIPCRVRWRKKEGKADVRFGIEIEPSSDGDSIPSHRPQVDEDWLFRVPEGT